MRLERLPLSEWADVLPSDGFEPFHTAEALGVLADHTDGDLHLFAGYKGRNPVALLPLFVRRRSIGTMVTSPPPGLSVPRLGPILMPASPKRSKRERLNRRFADAVIDELGLDGPRTLFRMIGNTSYTDPRPYRWASFDVNTVFTYTLDVEGRSADELLSNCSKSLRREIRDARELEVTVDTEGLDGAEAVYDQTAARYDQQDEPFQLSWAYVRDLFESLGKRARSYVARDPDGEFLSGITVLYSNDAAYFWQGGARGNYEGTTVNSLLHWRIVEDLIEDPPVASVSGYDLMGANTDRLCRYKSKFGASLEPYYTIESAGARMNLAKRAYRTISR
ncbi:MAG: GNAT family N-acetyltransferase [Halohasta sp.]